MKKLIYLLLIITGLCGCDIHSESPVAEEELTLDETTLAFLESQGFPRHEVVLKGNDVIIGGDGFLPLEDVKNAMLSNSSGRTKQYRATFFASPARAGFVLVYVKPTVPLLWKTAISEAIVEWNNLNKDVNPLGEAGVRFYMAASENAHLVISAAPMPPNQFAISQFPDSDGYVGATMTLANPAPSVKRKSIIMHELGHILGLRHSDWATADAPSSLGAIKVTGTPTSDLASIMNANALYLPNKFSNYDVIAINTLWPWDWWQ